MYFDGCTTVAERSGAKDGVAAQMKLRKSFYCGCSLAPGPSEVPYPRFARSRSEGTSPRYHEGTEGTPVPRDSRTFQRACSSIGQLVGRRENQNGVHILDSSVSVYLTDVSIVISHILISHREIFLEENIIRPLQSLVRPSRRVRNSPDLPLSKRKAETLRLHSLTLVGSPIIV